MEMKDYLEEGRIVKFADQSIGYVKQLSDGEIYVSTMRCNIRDKYILIPENYVEVSNWDYNGICLSKHPDSYKHNIIKVYDLPNKSIELEECFSERGRDVLWEPKYNVNVIPTEVLISELERRKHEKS